MPSFVTHGLMALDVYNQIPTSRVKSAIKAHPSAFLLGSNGPDILFYYQSLPWQNAEKNKYAFEIGDLIHTSKINEFYDYSIKFIRNIHDDLRKDILISYLAGHLQHWALDTIAHPFIFYRAGALDGLRPYDHYRYESSIDALMILYVKGRKMKDVNVKRFVDVNIIERRVIASFYQSVLKEVFNIEENTEFIEESILSMRKALSYLYDPNNVIFPLVKKYERRYKNSWQYSSHIVSSKINAKEDVLNLKHETWMNPCEFNSISTQSFIDLYNQSIELGIDTIKHFDILLVNNQRGFEELLRGRNYDTGLNNDKEMKYFDSIYLK